MLYFSQRSRVDLKLTSGYHCTRVKDPTDQDFSKFRHLTGCMWATRFIPLIISICDKGEIVTHSEEVHSAYDDVKGNYGMFLTMDKGAMMSVSKKLGVVAVS